MSAGDATEDGAYLFRRAVDVIGQVLIPAGVVTALLYYFGYTRERAFFSYFGVHVGTLDFGSSDYVLRSAQAVFSPLAALFVGGLVVLLVHQLVRAARREEAPTWWRAAWIGVVVVSLGLLGVGVSGLFLRPELPGPRASAVALGVGALLLEYAVWMSTADPRLPPSVLETVESSRGQRRSLVVGIALVAAFWWTATAAHQNGIASARAVQASLEARGEAVVLSDQRLGITRATGVVAEPLSKDAGFAFRYTGLRVLVSNGDQWFLVPRGWTRDNGDTVIVLPHRAEGLRVDLRP